jgi:hypothetical protein
MLPRSLPALLFALGWVLSLGFLLWLLRWKYKFRFDPQTLAAIGAGRRPPGFPAMGSLLEVVSKPRTVLVLLALITSLLWTVAVLLLLSQAIQSGHSAQYSQQVSPVRFWLQMGRWGLALLGGVAVLSWAIWSLLSRPEDRARLTATASQRALAVMDNLVEKPKFVLLLYAVAISLGFLVIADSVMSGQIIGWTVPSKRGDSLFFWEAIAFWGSMTGWVGVRFLQELRKYFRKRAMDR